MYVIPVMLVSCGMVRLIDPAELDMRAYLVEKSLVLELRIIARCMPNDG